MEFYKISFLIKIVLLLVAIVFSGFYLLTMVNFLIQQKLVSTTEKTITTTVQKDLLWREVTSEASWEPRDSGEVFVFQNKMWLMGGLSADNEKNNQDVKYWEAEHFNDIWNTKDGVNWKKVASSSAWTPRRSMSVVLFNNKLWMLGGWSPISSYTNDIWTSNDGINWEQVVVNAPWPAREGQLLEVFQNKMWLIGGVNYDERQTKNDIWYSVDGIEWTRVENVPWKPRWDHATEVFKGKLFLTGGMNLANEVFNDVWVSENGLDWTLVTDNPPWESRQGHALISYKGKLWLIGRFNDIENGGVNDVWYSDDGIVWEKTISNPGWAGREDFFSTVFDDKIWVFGGMDRQWQWRNDVWMFTSELNIPAGDVGLSSREIELGKN